MSTALRPNAETTPESDAPEVSVIIPARNAADTLGDQLAALAGQTYDGRWEIIVVDNGSQDATTDIAESWRRHLPHLRVLHAPGTHSAARARNVGARASRGDLLLFCDADDVVDREWVTQLAKGLRDFPTVAGAVERCSLNPAAQLAWRPTRPTDTLPNHFRFLPYGQGANCGIRRHIWREIAGFDEQFRHSEDVAFFWRIQLARYEIGFAPDAVVSYRYRSTLRATIRQNFNYGRSHAQLYRRFAAAGMPRRRVAAIQEWWWITTHTPQALGSRQARGVWLARAARCIGRLIGSLQHRTLYL
ncbi:glycosyltransferase family 2 protein [Nocardia sp. 2YAB30]|uniref:glycosyltransferase n=1 Tax=unclassified Nocardia TaxID=2637762 RepID=UPI003F9C0AC3